MRDGGFEMSVDNKNWHIIHSDEDFTKPSAVLRSYEDIGHDISQNCKSE
jgi:hypothetical protein